MGWVSIGYLSSSHGIKGMAKAKATGDSWEQLEFPKNLQFSKNNNSKTLLVTSASIKPNYILLECENISTPEFWEDWKGATISVPESDLDSMEKREDEFFYYQLEGLDVLDENLRYTGFSVTQVYENTAHEILECSNAGKIIMIPFVNEWVGAIDLDNKTVVVKDWENWIAL